MLRFHSGVCVQAVRSRVGIKFVIEPHKFNTCIQKFRSYYVYIFVIFPLILYYNSDICHNLFLEFFFVLKHCSSKSSQFYKFLRTRTISFIW